MLSYFTSEQVTVDPEEPLYNDANWCNDEYDALYEQQKVELDPEASRAGQADAADLLRRHALCRPLQVRRHPGIRQDRWTNFVRQPAETGPVLFTNTSPAYVQLRAAEGGGDGGGSNTGLIIGGPRPASRSSPVWVCGPGPAVTGRTTTRRSDPAATSRRGNPES